MVDDVSIVAGIHHEHQDALDCNIILWLYTRETIIIIPIIRGSDSSPDPNVFIAITVIVISVEGWQNEEDTSNVCLHTPLSEHDVMGMVVTWLQMLPVLESL